MSKNKLWVIGATLIMVITAASGWLIGVQPQLAAAGNANRDRANVKALNAGHEALLVKLKRDYQNIEALRVDLTALRIGIPASAEMPSFVTQLNFLARSHGVIVKSISVSDAKPYLPVSAAGGSTAAPANPKITSENFVAIPVQLAITGPYAKALDFVHDVQTSARIFLVATFSSTGTTRSKGAVGTKQPESTSSDTVDATIGGFVYVLLDKANK